jgi:hypothetical protein
VTVIVFVRCEQCEMTFRDGEQLKRHRVAHEPEEPEVLGASGGRPQVVDLLSAEMREELIARRIQQANRLFLD